MSTIYVTQISREHQISIDKSVWIKENLEVGDFVEVIIRKVEKTPKSESGSPYSL